MIAENSSNSHKTRDMNIIENMIRVRVFLDPNLFFGGRVKKYNYPRYPINILDDENIMKI